MIKRIFKSCDFSKENNPDKDYLQQMLYSAADVKGPATIVTGVAVERHIHDFEKYVQTNKATLDIVEINKDIYQKISIKCKALNKSYIKVHNCNVANSIIHRFVDADLTATAENTLPIFKILFLRMQYLLSNPNAKKALICTYCSRGSKISQLDMLRNITGLEFSKPMISEKMPTFNTQQGVYCIKNTYIYGNVQASVISYRFKDSSPMVTILIKWMD